MKNVLDSKIAKFIKWYKNTLYDGNYRSPKEIINFIEKMAVWYELRYPEYEIAKTLKGVYKEEKDVTEEMFYKNNEISKLLNNSNNKIDLTFSNFYNKEAFINSLPSEESDMLRKPSFLSVFYLGPVNSHIHFNEDGIVNEMEEFSGWSGRQLHLEGLKAEECEKILRNIKLLPKKNPLQEAIQNYNNELKFRNDLLECVIYRIIERGGEKIGAKRAMLFAREFNSNVNIPVAYLLEFSSEDQYNLISDFVSGGGGDTLCILSKPTNKIYKLKK